MSLLSIMSACACASFAYTVDDMDKLFLDVFKCPHFIDDKNDSHDWRGHPQVTIENFGLTKDDLEYIETLFDFEWNDIDVNDMSAKLENSYNEHDDELREHLVRGSRTNGLNNDNDSSTLTTTDDDSFECKWNAGHHQCIRVSKEQIARCILFIGVKHSLFNETLAEWLKQFVEDCVGTPNKSNKKWYKTYGSTVSESWSSGNLIDFICSFETKDLFARGW